ncbi:hypothetical protein [Alistipes sp.]|uniref:hypothetical protein n=1 Tax=Alistipes sp. TaxID=1872444 RepID=UPI003AF15D1B
MEKNNSQLAVSLCGFAFLALALFGMNLYENGGAIRFSAPFVVALLFLIIHFSAAIWGRRFLDRKKERETDVRRIRQWEDLYYVISQHAVLLLLAFGIHYAMIVFYGHSLPLGTEVGIYVLVWLVVVVPVSLYRLLKRDPNPVE